MKRQGGVSLPPSRLFVLLILPSSQDWGRARLAGWGCSRLSGGRVRSQGGRPVPDIFPVRELFFDNFCEGARILRPSIVWEPGS